MPAQTLDIVIEQGAEFGPLPLEYTDSEGNPKNLTGYTGKAQVRVNYSSVDVMLEFEVSLGGKAGTITLTAKAEDTAAMTRSGFWDLKLTPSGGEPFRLLEGRAKFSPAVTK